MLIDSGLRLSEMMGLKWSDVDLNNANVSVTKANQALGGKGIFTKSTKNQSSFRNVAISNSTVNFLKTYHMEQLETKSNLADKWIDENWVFTQWNGKPMYPTTPSYRFKKFLKRYTCQI